MAKFCLKSLLVLIGILFSANLATAQESPATALAGSPAKAEEISSSAAPVSAPTSAATVSATTPQATEPRIEVKASRLHGLLVFTFSNASFPHYSPFLKEYSDRSKYKDEIAKILGDMEPLENSLRRGTSFREEAKGYGDGFSVQDLAEIQSAYAKDIDDLMLRLQSTMPVEDLVKFGKVLKALDPIYEDLIWSKNRSDILLAEKVYTEKLKEWKAEKLLKAAKTFYRSSWPEDLKFSITLYPIPKEAHHSNAHSLGAFESVGLVIGETDLVGRFGVMFHEMMHSLYNAQEFAVKKELLSWFNLNQKDADLPYREGAQNFSNEIYATLLGNAWAFEKITGKVDPNSWYSEVHIEGTSRGMNELTKSYLESGKPIDADYVKALCAKFKELFPDYPNSADYLFKNLEIYQTGKFFNAPEIRHTLRSIYRNVSLGIRTDSDLLTHFRPGAEKVSMLLLSAEEAKNLTPQQISKLGIPPALKAKLKKGKTGMWRWEWLKQKSIVLLVSTEKSLATDLAGKINVIPQVKP